MATARKRRKKKKTKQKRNPLSYDKPKNLLKFTVVFVCGIVKKSN